MKRSELETSYHSELIHVGDQSKLLVVGTVDLRLSQTGGTP